MSDEQSVRFEIDPRGFAIGRIVRENHHHTLTEAQRAFGTLQSKLEGRRLPLLMDIRQVTKMDTEARTFYAESSSASVTCLALLTPSLLSKIAANFFIAAASMLGEHEKMPIKLFDKEEEAVQWILKTQDQLVRKSA